MTGLMCVLMYNLSLERESVTWYIAYSVKKWFEKHGQCGEKPYSLCLW